MVCLNLYIISFLSIFLDLILLLLLFYFGSMKRYMTWLLSLLPLSCMIASERDLANTLFSFFSNPQSYQLESFTNQQMNIEINMPRGQSMSSSPNNSRELSIHSNVSSMAYADRIQPLVNNPI